MESPADDDGGRSRNPSKERTITAKSCKGCLYHSSALNSKSRNPRCIGISKTLHQVPYYLVKEAEEQLYKDDHQLAEFKYSCIGYSAHIGKKGQLTKKSELPFCVGLEILMSRKVAESGADIVLAHPHTNEGNRLSSLHDLSSTQPRPYKPASLPASPAREDFINRFARSATLVASGVVKNANKVCNQMKSVIDDILYPYRRPPK